MQVLIDTGSSRLWIQDNYTPDLYPFLQNLPLTIEPPIFIHGKERCQRRDIGFFSDIDIGRSVAAIPSSQAPILQWLLPEVNKSLNTEFNGILVNRYANGEKYISAHSDKERKKNGC